jgi:WD40 repeat protein
MYAINHLAFSPDNKHFVTCSMDKSIKVWDAEKLALLKVIDRSRHAGHGTSVNKVLWTNYDNQLLSASDDRTISVWSINFETQDV